MNNSLDIRSQFPLLTNFPQLVYLDNAATTHKPQMVLEAEGDFYLKSNATVHRGIYPLAEKATLAFEDARDIVRKFFSASLPEEIIFTRGTTEALNLIASSLPNIKAGDEILVTQMEHHSNLTPWQQLAQRTQARLVMLPITPEGAIDISTWQTHLSPNTKVIAFTHASNVLGTINPAKELIKIARQYAPQSVIILDGAQAVAHLPVNVVDLDCDFYACSGHKMYAPMGIGVLYGKKKCLEQLNPYQTGGGTLNNFSLTKTEYRDLPHRFEAGTPNIAGAIGLAAAIKFIESVTWETIQTHEQILLAYGQQVLNQFPELTLQGTSPTKLAVFSFHSSKVHSHDLASILGAYQVAVRAGHHCALPLMKYYQVSSTLRASVAIYNQISDFDLLAKGLQYARKIFKTL